MATVMDIYHAIDKVAPFSSALSFDNVGILVGDSQAEVKSAMIVLDITPEIVKEAAGKNVDLIISHHPVIFSPLKSVTEKDIAYHLIAHRIAAIGCHTNLDLSPVCGVNVALGKALKLEDIQLQNEIGEGHILFTGELPMALSPKEFATLVKESLQSKRVHFCEGKNRVKKIAFCSGAGADEMLLAQKCGADAFLTGEMKHHEELEAARLGLTIVTAGHFETEVVFAKELLAYLEDEVKDVRFSTSVCEKAAFEVL
ncbi:Nif3-like dinuclear metal center hexameric protein [Scatolibacter rhodanostii]|uniref:Nif3-like dinuclear metal center hexameric protein n=1 Tax=Scatolibacter rhodanostii TaxID=2014781 RepID=UPI000C082AD8|nr:Nif3-like dinuclear metal center hexameric protein [Scatolibacter rhodanostii]